MRPASRQSGSEGKAANGWCLPIEGLELGRLLNKEANPSDANPTDANPTYGQQMGYTA